MTIHIESLSELDVMRNIFYAMQILRANTIKAAETRAKKIRVSKLRRSNKTKALWAKNPEYRERVLTALNSPEVKRKRIAGLRRHYVEHPEDRERQSKIIKTAYRNNPDIGRIKSEKMVDWWDDPKNLQKQSAIRKNNSELMKKRWSDPDYKQRIIEALGAARQRRKKSLYK
jgi:hypothetical protein